MPQSLPARAGCAQHSSGGGHSTSRQELGGKEASGAPWKQLWEEADVLGDAQSLLQVEATTFGPVKAAGEKVKRSLKAEDSVLLGVCVRMWWFQGEACSLVGVRTLCSGPGGISWSCF